MIVFNETRNRCIASKCSLADTFVKRFIGLMGKSELPDNYGLMISPCNSIHMFFMRFPLDIIFIDKENKVVHQVENILPWKVSRIVPQARSAIELPVGTIRITETTLGDQLSII
ncbi:MAG: DUF192 domain-containing protein [Clostridia bacterium]|nr:DUF192 domain-containing protein [Clostridia bacterium]